MAEATIEIPDPALVVLVGPAGAGKSTLAGRHFEAGEILSSDAFRAFVSGDAADQAASGAAFAALHRSLERRLAAGRLTVVDATNLRPAARRALVVRAAAAGVPAVAIVLEPGAAAVRERAAARAERLVEPDVVERHLDDLAALTGSERLLGEGFAAVHRLAGPEAADRVVVVRRPR